MSEPAVFLTPFTMDPHECTSASIDSGLRSIDEVIAVMGPDFITRTGGYVIYPQPDPNQRLIFSRLRWA